MAAPSTEASPSQQIQQVTSINVVVLPLTSETEILEAAAKGAARLVSSGLSNVSRAPPSPDLLAKLLGLLGFDNSKLGAIAINAIIFIAQLIRTVLTETDTRESEPPSEDPTSWIFENSPMEARELVKQATERTLPEKLIEAVRDSSPMSTDCVELLICKGAPLMWSMQRALSRPPGPNWTTLSPLDRMYAGFPPLEQVADQAAVCDVRFPACRIKYGHL
ncbi:uncharacterized protein [Halyomorpha halys]|uniref:uncharacterized protein isoform X2 n=1 Tax=Halyomorpha halys TaxID=286706 RepID=UPI000D0C823D|nr:uncharacterized protein LOC106689104 isoform X2 [Halyomorpha halys]